MLLLFLVVCTSEVFSEGLICALTICNPHPHPQRSQDDGFIKAWSTSETGSVTVTCPALICKVPRRTFNYIPIQGTVKAMACLEGRASLLG